MINNGVQYFHLIEWVEDMIYQNRQQKQKQPNKIIVHGTMLIYVVHVTISRIIEQEATKDIRKTNRLVDQRKEDLKVLGKVTTYSMSMFILPDGTVLFSLYTALFVKGRRWGTLSAGLSPKALGF